MHHLTLNSMWVHTHPANFVPYPLTIELLGETQAKDAPPLLPEEDQVDTATGLDIPELTETPGKPKGPNLLILTPKSVPILLPHSQQSMGQTQQ